MRPVLLTVSGVVDSAVREQVAQGTRPCPDYLAMADAFNADILDYAEARRTSGRLGTLLERLGGPNLLLAWACFKRRRAYQVIFTDGEQVGIPFATLCMLGGRKRPRHMMIVHIISVPKKRALIDLLRLYRYIDTWFVYATSQKCFIEQRWQVPADRVVWTPFMVDADFFRPQAVEEQRRPMICSVGLEFRDYPTLLKAVDGLDVEVVIAAASPWSKREDTTAGQRIPANVHVRRFSQYELRQLYADSQFVVMPLQNVPFQAGVTAILEAMAMERAVICSRTTGQTDILVDNETGIYVPPGDALALRAAIEGLLADPDQVAKLGHTGRRDVEQRLNLKVYADRLNQVVQKVLMAEQQ